MSACRNWRFRFDPEDDTHMPLLPLPYAEIPMVLGFSGWHPCLSVTNRLVDRRQFGSLVRSLARPLPVVVHSLVQSPTRSRARSLPPFSLSSYSDYQLPLVSIIFKLLLYALFSIRVTRLSPPSLSVIESFGLIGRAGKSSGRVTKIASCSSIYRVCADIVGESLSFPRRER